MTPPNQRYYDRTAKALVRHIVKYQQCRTVIQTRGCTELFNNNNNNNNNINNNNSSNNNNNMNKCHLTKRQSTVKQRALTHHPTN